MILEHVDEIINTIAPVCVTVILPLDGRDHRKDMKRLVKRTKDVKVHLQSNPMNSEMKKLVEKFLDNAVTTTPGPTDQALGIYVSDSNAYCIPLPLSVKPRMVVRDRFSVRELLYLKQYQEAYCVLQVSKYVVRLYCGNADILTEVLNDHFPMHIENRYYNHLPYTRYPADRVVLNPGGINDRIEPMHVRSLFREADANLRKFMTGNTMKLIVAGKQAYLQLFRDVTTLAVNIIGELRGHYHHGDSARLSALAWNLYMRDRASELGSTVNELLTNTSAKIVSGLSNVWSRAMEGTKHTLVVEKSFHHKAYRKPGIASLFLDTPTKPYDVVDDAADSVVEMVRSREGQVIIGEDGSLGEYGHIALSLLKTY